MRTLPVSEERMAALEQYAHKHGKQPADVLDDALAKFLDYETWFSEAVGVGISAADRGELVDHEEISALIETRYSG